ncbi:glutamine--fructose-6-phosphate transaminase (isomerizing) [Pyrofollis japonicus]|uniref:glutamine--fructose-6-phosphate transaminase (isomerizing) n=1 Tax=Pyrofollis japonicus TaxID=3060460 RepID=UPI00295BAF54|nr:glutamine--fructose-6-phosphate transaminase (isomerizing) [Pyrofollis japonicus]BEP16971.1 glutamine--fructose-6-phosphate transaminase (isomerizing) [Pyrofollis japonicus]
MCGIVGVTADPDQIPTVTPMLIQGLKRLEYRGYDSAGFAIIECGSTELKIFKDKGKIDEVVSKYGVSKFCAVSGIAHTRWATHGEPNRDNAHPHTDCKQKIAVVHNGIIKNFAELREWLESNGHVFKSETDTEVVAHLLEHFVSKGLSMLDSLRRALSMIEGAYALAIVYREEPSRIYFARNVSPLLIGVGLGFNMVSSDIPSMLQYTRKVIVLEDGEYGYIEPYKVYIEKEGRLVDWRRRVVTIMWSLEDAEKGGYPHYMLKEIMEQPRALYETYTGLRSSAEISDAAELIASSDKIFITGAGTSFHAALVFAYYLARFAKRAVMPFIASEYITYSGLAERDSVLIVVSQSGETIDSLQALRAFKRNGSKIIAVSNVIGSTIPRESNIAVYTRAGPEIGVAATKTFLTQVLALTALALRTANLEGSLNDSEYAEYFDRLANASKVAAQAIQSASKTIERLAVKLKESKSMYILGRGLGVPLAYEGALKIKEVSYIHAEAYPAGESKHGPIALIEPGFPVIFLGTPPVGELHEKIQGNVMEMKARGAATILLAVKGYEGVKGVDVLINVGEADEILAPYALMPPLQLLAYRLATALGRDPDKPRNLAKTVTVE